VAGLADLRWGDGCWAQQRRSRSRRGCGRRRHGADTRRRIRQGAGRSLAARAVCVGLALALFPPYLRVRGRASKAVPGMRTVVVCEALAGTIEYRAVEGGGCKVVRVHVLVVVTRRTSTCSHTGQEIQASKPTNVPHHRECARAQEVGTPSFIFKDVSPRDLEAQWWLW
jgi:hypothetical protein